MNNRFKTAFVIGLMVTVCAWTMAFVFSAIAGESPKGSLKKVETKLNSKQKNISEKREVQLAGVETIKVSTGSKDIKVVPTDGDQLIVEFRGRSNIENPLEITTEGNVLKVGLKKEMENSMTWSLSFDSEDEEELKMGLYVGVPKSWSKNVEISGGSSDIRALAVDLNSLIVETGSGDIALSESKVGTMSLKTGSGDVSATRLSGDLNVVVGSGDVEVQEFDGESLKVAAASGDVSLNKFTAKSVIGSAASGDIVAKPTVAQGWKFNLSAASGDISNSLAEDANGDKTMRFSTASGDISVLQ